MDDRSAAQEALFCYVYDTEAKENDVRERVQAVTRAGGH
jgi:hypothetical protein